MLASSCCLFAAGKGRFFAGSPLLDTDCSLPEENRQQLKENRWQLTADSEQSRGNRPLTEGNRSLTAGSKGQPPRNRWQSSTGCWRLRLVKEQSRAGKREFRPRIWRSRAKDRKKFQDFWKYAVFFRISIFVPSIYPPKPIRQFPTSRPS
jgi:hypothetical protein